MPEHEVLMGCAGGISLLQTRRVPDAHLIHANGHQGIAIGQKGERTDGSRMPGQRCHLLFGNQIPEGDESVECSNRQSATVG